ncbi:DUF2971 domain-containing protein [Pseudomonas sp. CFBP 5750]
MKEMEASKKLYRIMDFTKVVQIFEKKELYFANPSSWDDPYERHIKHSRNHAIFAQCWSRRPISDAMWRIYSQNGMGVRISTTNIKMRAALQAAAKSKKYSYRVARVSYKTQADLIVEAKKIASDLNERFDISRAVDALYMKRDAFIHEVEWRAALYSKSENAAKDQKGFIVPVEPHEFIDRILLDPRAPDELVRTFKFYFESCLGYKGSVQRSQLYQSPETIEIEEILADQL